jgi:hypothetical protein
VTKPVKDIAASVRRRLMNAALASGRPFQEVLEYYAMERFLYRLARSGYAGRFVLKGALLFRAWGGAATRPTRDIDLLARVENTVEAVVPIFREVCGVAVEPDGMVFDPATMAGAVIREDADYSGVRVTFLGTLQNARVAMQIDLGFADVVTPGPVPTDYPVILEFPAPQLSGYPRETVVAEKFEAMVKLEALNSRMGGSCGWRRRESARGRKGIACSPRASPLLRMPFGDSSVTASSARRTPRWASATACSAGRTSRRVSSLRPRRAWRRQSSSCSTRRPRITLTWLS